MMRTKQPTHTTFSFLPPPPPLPPSPVFARPTTIPFIPETLTTRFDDDFAGTQLDAVRFSFTSAICDKTTGFSYWSSSCGTGLSATALVSGGSVKITTVGYQYMAPPGISSYYITMTNKYGRNGVPFIERKTSGEVGVNNVFYTSVEGDGIGVSATPWYYYEAGFVVYDTDINGTPRPILLYYYRYATNSASYNYINRVYVRYFASGAWSSATTMYFDRSPSSGCDLYLVRNAWGRSWQFAYRRIGIDAYPMVAATCNGCAPYEVFDTQIGGVSWSANNTFVGLYAETTYPTARTVGFSFYKIIDPTWWSGTYMQAIADSRARNATIASGGICAVAREIVKTVPFPLSRINIMGVYNGEGYTIGVVANGATGTTSTRVNVPGVITPVPTPMGLSWVNGNPPPTPGLFLDGLSARPSGTSDFTFWRDVSGGGNHFGRKNGATGAAPKVAFPTATNRQVGVYFSQTPGELVQDDPTNTFLNFPAASTQGCTQISCPPMEALDTTWFILYKPIYSYQTSHLFIKGDNYGGQGTGSGWEIISMYYGWPDSSLGMRIYGSGTTGAGISQPVVNYVHPHANAPTLLTYSYNFKEVVGGISTHRLHACENVETSTNADKCSQTLLSTSAPSTANPWKANFNFAQYGPNFATVAADSPTNFDGAAKWGNFAATTGLARISDARILSGW
jgi:hypothetical protein